MTRAASIVIIISLITGCSGDLTEYGRKHLEEAEKVEDLGEQETLQLMARMYTCATVESSFEHFSENSRNIYKERAVTSYIRFWLFSLYPYCDKNFKRELFMSGCQTGFNSFYTEEELNTESVKKKVESYCGVYEELPIPAQYCDEERATFMMELANAQSGSLLDLLEIQAQSSGDAYSKFVGDYCLF